MSDADLFDVSLTMYHALDDIGWQQSFDPGSLSRGLAYARQGKVRGGVRPEPEGQLLILRAHVSGSGRSRYLTNIAVDPNNPGLGVVSDCSCPVGRQCKHAVAVISTFLDEMKAQGMPARDNIARLEQRWEAWLDELVSPPGYKIAKEQVDDTHRLALFLDIDPHPQLPTLKVLPVWLRPSKQRARGNGWVKPRPMFLGRGGGLSPQPSGGLASREEEALELLMQGESRRQLINGYDYQWSLVSHTFQIRALKSLLESEAPPLLFYQKQTGAMLELGPTCQLTLAWEPDAEGYQHLRADAEPSDVISDDAVITRAGRELCYLDSEQGRFGLLKGDLDLLQRLRHSPPLPPAMSGWLTERLHHTPALAERLPAPEAVEEHTLEDVAPRLKVNMQVGDGQLGYREGALVPSWIQVGAAVVSLDYDGIEVSLEDGESARAFRDGQRLTILRDHDAERALVRALPSGMLTLDYLKKIDAIPAYLELPTSTLLLPIDGIAPSSTAEWSTHLAGPDDWWDMIGQLREAGCLVTFANDFPEEPTYLEPDEWYGELEPADNGWFDLALDIEVEGERLNLLPILRRLLKDPTFPVEPMADEAPDATWTLALPENRRLVMPLARLRALMSPILDWLNDESNPDAAVRLPLTAVEKVTPLAEQEHWAGRGEVTALAERLHALPVSLPVPPGFAGELRDYQSRGIAWMRFLAELGTGGILADDMGLGKTIQVLAHVLDERARDSLKGPTLVVAPTSLVGNWCAETARFAPGLNVVALQGGRAQRERQFDETLHDADLIVTTYALLIRDIERLREYEFGLLVLDEAQAIKNAASQTARAVRALNAKRAIAMTGTPLENHLGELWAQLDAVAPGALGSQQWFGQHFRTPIEKESDIAQRERLSRRIAPLMLRRTKQQVLAELPEKTEVRRDVTLAGAQRELYESLRLSQHQRVQQAVAERGLAGSGIVMLDALLKLRQVCCDPRLVKLESARSVNRSAKLEQLRELVPPLVEEGRRILIFSQFTQMLELIGETLEKDGIPFTMLTGDTPGKTRTQRVALFQQGEIPVFLISLKAGGTGLNLTAADTVIHYDPWWNPAVEAQATGRAHRMGQLNPVFVYKLVCAGTLEERILDLQARKSDLAVSILEGGAERHNEGALFDEEDLALLFAPVS